MPWRFLSAFLFLTVACAAPRTVSRAGMEESRAVQEQLNQEYLDPATSILSDADRLALADRGGLSFFPLSENYIVDARLERYPDPETVEIPTSGPQPARFYVYGRLLFELQGRPDTLDVFLTTNRYLPEEYRNLLFVPFRDETSGEDTYGGGRYLDVLLPETDRVTLDFNRAYHPYCAYTDGYACPVPPAQNYLEQRVEAGVRNTAIPSG